MKANGNQKECERRKESNMKTKGKEHKSNRKQQNTHNESNMNAKGTQKEHGKQKERKRKAT